MMPLKAQTEAGLRQNNWKAGSLIVRAHQAVRTGTSDNVLTTKSRTAHRRSIIRILRIRQLKYLNMWVK